MSSNISDSRGEGGEERFAAVDIYSILIASVYGTLIFIICIHLIIHWLLRRKRLRPHPLHVPGDRSFKHKKIRGEIKQEIERVRNLTTDLRLIDTSLPASTYGITDDHTPNHWFRMKAFDAGADFVTTYIGLLKEPSLSPSPQRLALPHFLSLLQEHGLLTSEHQLTFNMTSQLYTHARTGSEDFTHSHFQKFKEQLELLNQILSSHQRHLFPQFSSSSTTPITPQATPTTLWRERLSAKNSQEPLIDRPRSERSSYKRIDQPSVPLSTTITATPPTTSTSTPKTSVTGATSYSTRRDSRGGQRPTNLELTPLVSTDVHFSPASVLSSRTDTHVFMPGTPV